MKTEDHIKRTGGIGAEVHTFLDMFYRMFGEDHRVMLHHAKGIRLIGKVFGDYAIGIAEAHIKDDFDGKIPKGHDDRNYYRPEWAFDIEQFRKAKKFATFIVCL